MKKVLGGLLVLTLAAGAAMAANVYTNTGKTYAIGDQSSSLLVNAGVNVTVEQVGGIVLKDANGNLLMNSGDVATVNMDWDPMVAGPVYGHINFIAGANFPFKVNAAIVAPQNGSTDMQQSDWAASTNVSAGQAISASTDLTNTNSILSQATAGTATITFTPTKVYNAGSYTNGVLTLTLGAN